jgi:hypothetical protein
MYIPPVSAWSPPAPTAQGRLGSLLSALAADSATDTSSALTRRSPSEILPSPDRAVQTLRRAADLIKRAGADTNTVIGVVVGVVLVVFLAGLCAFVWTYRFSIRFSYRRKRHHRKSGSSKSSKSSDGGGAPPPPPPPPPAA